MNIFYFIFLLSVWHPHVCSQSIESACPDKFYYQHNGAQYYGTLTVPPVKMGETLEIVVLLAVESVLTNNFLGSIELIESQREILEANIDGLKIHYNVTVPIQAPLPKLQKLLYNGKSICSDDNNEEYYNRAMIIRLSHSYSISSSNNKLQTSSSSVIMSKHLAAATRKPDLVPIKNPMFERDQINDHSCGIPRVTFLNGSSTYKGEFPWLVAMFNSKEPELAFHCGATLISRTRVISAAHCTFYGTEPLTITSMKLFIGQFDLADWSERIAPELKQILVHPDFKAKSTLSYDADIAMIILSKPIDYTLYIRPACVWNWNTNENWLATQIGTVVGWGKDQAGNVADIPNKIQIPIVTNDICRGSNDNYALITSDRTFCAGKKDVIGPCQGDSGGPFLILYNGQWFLKGIISVSFRNFSTAKCDANIYAGFTDVAKFSEWILRN